MRTLPSRIGILAITATLGFGTLAGTLGAERAEAAPSTSVVISEVYGAGGNNNALYNRDFIELQNVTGSPVSLSGLSVTYYSAKNNPGGTVALTGTIPANGTYLIGGGNGGANGDSVGTVDAESTLNLSATNGSVELNDASGAVVDLVGFGTTSRFETQSAPSPSATTSVARTAPFADTDNNAVDFTLGAPTPKASGASTDPEPTDPGTPGDTRTIAEIQGTGDVSRLAGETVTTVGVVTATYPVNGKDGFYIQTPGTADPAAAASTGLFVYARAATSTVKIGDSVSVTGKVSEYFTQTQLTSDSVTVLDSPLGTVTPAAVAWPRTDAERERYEGMLIAPAGDYVVTDNYDLNSYGQITLASGTTPLVQPTEVATPGSAEAIAQEQDNLQRKVILDDGASIDFSKNAAAKNSPLPYLTLDTPVTVGAAASFSAPVIVDYSFSEWRFQPQQQVIGLEHSPASFSNARESAPASVGGDFTLGTFNVLNYFTDLGADEAGCAAYRDREGNPVTANNCSVRGAYSAAALAQQQAKIVAAINGLDSSIVALEEIENSARFGKDRDAALSTLVTALNADAGTTRWAFVPSPAAVPTTGSDVIRTAFIYQPEQIAYVDGSTEILDDPAFVNARAPLSATFTPVADPTVKVVVIANHFKSKGSGQSATGDNVEDTRGTAYSSGAWNGDRERQATALVSFATTQQQKAGTELMFLTGDFNSYSGESPVGVIEAAGFTNLTAPGEHSYLYKGMVGSLDHIFASPAAAALVTGHDIWTINAYEPIALEYSRSNYNVTPLTALDQYRSSDHNPSLVGIRLPGAQTTDPGTPTTDPGTPTTDPGTPTTEPGTSTPGATAVQADGTTGAGPLASTGAEGLSLLLGIAVLLVIAGLVTARARRNGNAG